ncbi:MAG: protein-L-isoaspartate(D-aspartate) O-methyltransferase [Anaerolineales bacterium]
MDTPTQADPFAEARRRMVREQVAARGIADARLLAAFERVPRHLFVDAASWGEAYEDHPLPIGYGQTISQPYIVALMTSLLSLMGDERVLEVGTGSGYQAAILAELAREVHTIEYRPELAARAAATLARLGYERVHVHTGDGTLGWPAAAPFDAVLVAAAAPRVPPPLLEQLVDGGRLVMPVGDRRLQYLEVWEKIGETLQNQVIIPVVFVPLRGAHGV